MMASTTDSAVSVDWHLTPNRTVDHSLLFATFTPPSHSASSTRPSSPSHARSISSPPSLASSTPSPDPSDSHSRTPPPPPPILEEEPLVKMATAAPRPVSLTYGISAVGRGFNWRWNSRDEETPEADPDDEREAERESEREREPEPEPATERSGEESQDSPSWSLGYSVSVLTPRPLSVSPPKVTPPPTEVEEPATIQPLDDDGPVPFPSSTTADDQAHSQPSSQRNSRPSSPRPRRRDSQKRVSLVAGRLSMISIQPPPSPPPLPSNILSPRLSRFGSNSSSLSIVSTAPPKSTDGDSFHASRSIDDFVIDGEAGRGAYGVVKRAREKLADGSLGESIILKQVVKSRILADCWKKHPRLGTIPIEIYVMSAISNTNYTLPYPRRPWDPLRAFVTGVEPPPRGPAEVVRGHPNICKLIDFWEDAHFYYLMLPNARPQRVPSKDTPGDLFDLVETYPRGLPPHLIRSYLGQLADSMAFLHAKGIVHRDIKDENVVLGEPDGVCILIDFGSSGVVRRAGWDTFSGTLDYAAPEILEGGRYMGKEQDIWAFGVVAFVLLVGECPFASKAEAAAGLGPPTPLSTPDEDAADPVAAFLDDPVLVPGPTKAGRALDVRCHGVDVDTGLDRAFAGLEPDGGGALSDAAALVRACLRVDPSARPTFEDVMRARFLFGASGWSGEWTPPTEHPGAPEVLVSPVQ